MFAMPGMFRPKRIFGHLLPAALLLLGATGCDHAVNKGKKQADGGIVYESGTEKGQKIQLPDGTEIIMNAGTVIRISPDFGKSNRDLEFGGEALFDVAGDAGKSFIVHTRNLQILVLGTRFRVDAYPDKAGEEVDLLSGRLKVMKSYHSNTDNQPETLQAGEMVMINREIDLMEKEKLSAAELKAIEKNWGIGPAQNN